MYIVKQKIASLAHGSEFPEGALLYGNEFQPYTFASLLADGIIAVHAPEETSVPEEEVIAPDDEVAKVVETVDEVTEEVVPAVVAKTAAVKRSRGKRG
jgi:hypothetical protein